MSDASLRADRDPAVSGWRRVLQSRWGLLSIAAAIGLAIAYGAGWLLGPHPDATLRPTDASPLASMDDYLGDALVEIDRTTFEPYEMFRGLQPWSATDKLGNPCLIIVEPATGSAPGRACTPAGADLLVDVGAWPAEDGSFAEGLPDGTVLRFQLRGHDVDVTVHRPSDPD